MGGGQLLSVRSGRVVALGRAVLALFLMGAFLLGPPTTTSADAAVQALLIGNLAWAFLLVAANRRLAFAYRLLRLPVLLLAVDVTIFTTLLYLTSGADSPYFSPFLMVILAATIQWGSRGAAIMGLITLAAFAPAGWQVFFGDDQGPQAPMTFVLRNGYTAVITFMLIVFGRHVERMVEELSRLSDPLADDASDTGPPIRECLRHALWVFGAQRGMFLWEEADEPYATLGLLDDGRFTTRSLPPDADDWVAADVADAVFLYQPASGDSVVRKGRRMTAGPRGVLSPALVAEATFERALVIPASTPGLTGWILVFDHDEPANEDLAVGAMVSAQVSVALERWESQRARREASAAEDRLRLARDLHDGVLQFLAGAGLQLDGISQATDLPQETEARLATLRTAILDEQRELRGFISTLRPARATEPQPRRALNHELAQLGERLSRYWTIEVTSEVTPPELSVSDRLNYDLGRIVREAVANAVRHGGARHVRVAACREHDRLALRIEDDGRGFAFEGEAAVEQLLHTGEAPRSLHERVRALDGRLELLSTTKGASVLIDVPLSSGAA